MAIGVANGVEASPNSMYGTLREHSFIATPATYSFIINFRAGIPAVPLSEETREDLYQQVVRDTRRIKQKFSTLQDEIWKTITDIQGLVQLTLGMGILSKDDEEHIRRTPSTVSIILTKHWSFLDFENLEHIVERKCGSAEKWMMKEYKEEVEMYCRRRVSEFPPNSLGSSSNNTGMKKLCVKLTLDDPALQSIRHLKMTIANILGCHTSNLVLQNVESGSVLVTYLVNDTISAKLVQQRMTVKQKADLKVNEVMWIRYDEKITIFSADTESSARQLIQTGTTRYNNYATLKPIIVIKTSIKSIE